MEFYIREITKGSKKKTYGPYVGYIEKLKEPIKLKGRVIKYKPIAKLSGKKGVKKEVMKGRGYDASLSVNINIDQLLTTVRYDRDNQVVFTITNIKNNEIIKYVNIRCLGKGSYGKVFLVTNKNMERNMLLK